MWGTDNATVFNQLISYYMQYDPTAKISYTQIAPADYDSELLHAFAEGNGPDIFEVGDRAVPKWQSILAPLPAAYSSQFGPLQLQNDFPSVVQSDFMVSSTATTSGIYALTVVH